MYLFVLHAPVEQLENNTNKTKNTTMQHEKVNIAEGKGGERRRQREFPGQWGVFKKDLENG